MNIFTDVKEAVSVKDAASFYGIKVNRNGMCICPFHNDRNPSMKVDRRYYCFGCQATGDVIDFVSNYFGIGLKEATIKIADDFFVDIGDSYHNRTNIVSIPIIPPVRSEEPEETDEDDWNAPYITPPEYVELMELCDLAINMLYWYKDHWKRVRDENKPEPENEWSDEFADAIEMISKADMLIDILLLGTEKEKQIIIDELISKNKGGEIANE